MGEEELTCGSMYRKGRGAHNTTATQKEEGGRERDKQRHSNPVVSIYDMLMDGV